MQYIYLSIISSILVIIGYIPEISSIIKTKQATIDNLYIWCCGSVFSIAFCALNEEYYPMSTHIIIFTMNSSTFLLKLYYYNKSNYNLKPTNDVLFITDTENPLHTQKEPLQ